MASAVRIPTIAVDEYLNTAFTPDRDYVDGVLEERRVDEFDHGDVQWALLEAINFYTPTLGIRARPEVRVQISPTRFRVPDVCVVSAEWKRTQIIVDPPLLCIEVLSPADRLLEATTRCKDYLELGVTQAWILDPKTRLCHIVTPGGTIAVHSEALTIPGTTAKIDLLAVFPFSISKGSSLEGHMAESYAS